MEGKKSRFSSCGSAANGCLLQQISDPEDDQLYLKECDILTKNEIEFVDIYPGIKHCLGLTSSNDLFIWGETLGPENTASKKEIIIQVPKLLIKLSAPPLAVATGFDHTAILTVEREMIVYGKNNFG